jgi:hypothetical protein
MKTCWLGRGSLVDAGRGECQIRREYCSLSHSLAFIAAMLDDSSAYWLKSCNLGPLDGTGMEKTALVMATALDDCSAIWAMSAIGEI